jgi:hypothetical protein
MRKSKQLKPRAIPTVSVRPNKENFEYLQTVKPVKANDFKSKANFRTVQPTAKNATYLDQLKKKRGEISRVINAALDMYRKEIQA